MKVSPSRIKALELCSYKFYLNEVLRLPEREHPKATLGKLAHRIFELILAKKRAAKLKRFMGTKPPFLSVYPGIPRFARAYARANNIPYDWDEMNGMLMVAFLALDPHYHPDWVYHTEKRYEIDFGDFVISGVIDLLIEKSDCFVILDLKSQGIRFTEAEKEGNAQASCYQLYVDETYHKPARVEFVMLRHPPTSRTPDKHLQIVEPRSAAQHAGFKVYLKEMYKTFNRFSLADAHANFCDKKYFCDKVCQFRKPFAYEALMDDKGLVSNHFPGEAVEDPTQRIEQRQFKGCPRFNH